MSDSFTTAVPQPVYGPTGIVLPTEDSILNGVQQDINTTLGGGINPALTNPTGQLATTETAIIGDNYAMIMWMVNQFDPALNSGRQQDAIGRIYFMSRIAGQPTLQPCTCAGLDGTVVPLGAVAVDPNQNLWLSQSSGTISGGSVTLDFAAAAIGPIPAPASLEIYQSVYGWESVTPTGSAILGTNTESPSQFEQRRQASVAANASQIIDAIQGQVYAVPGVLDFYGYDQVEATPQTVGGVTIGANSVYICVLGGSSVAIADAIWSKKGPGCGYTGDTTVAVTDPNPNYNSPAPQYNVTYQNAANNIAAFAALVTIKNNSGVPSYALALIQNAIVSAFAGLDGGSRARIGSTVFAARYYPGVALLGPWAQIVSIQIGVKIASGFTAAITGTTMTVSAVASGVITAGQLVQDPDGNVLQGTVILSGSGTTWMVSISQTVSSEAMTGTLLVNDATVNISQAPAISAGDIQLLLV